jgi:hypothetical protein
MYEKYPTEMASCGSTGILRKSSIKETERTKGTEIYKV